MQFYFALKAVRQKHCGDSFELSPASTTVCLTQIRASLNPSATRNDLYLSDWANNLELHI